MRKCLKRRCFSPLACGSWGYCREHNLSSDPMDAYGRRPDWLIQERRLSADAECIEEMEQE